MAREIGSRAERIALTRVVSIAVLCLLVVAPAVAQETVLVEFGSSMRYLENQADPGIGMTWIEEAFDDSTWKAGE